MNEEVWFRGLVLAALGRWGSSTAVWGSAVAFGLLHLAGGAQGRTPAYAVAQVVFAVLFGLVAAETVLLTGSLWPVIAWHAAYDLSSYLGEDAFDSVQALSVVLQCLLLAAYAAYLWRRRHRT